MTEALPRRRFLIGAATGTAAVTVAGAFAAPDLAAAQPQETAPETQAETTAPAAETPEYIPEPMQVLTATEAAFVAAAADAMIPADDAVAVGFGMRRGHLHRPPAGGRLWGRGQDVPRGAVPHCGPRHG